jgi:hypothetical protein
MSDEKKPQITLVGKVDSVKSFGVRKASENITKPVATGSNYEEFEKFLVQLKLVNIPSPIPNTPAEVKLVSAKVSDRTSKVKKLEPKLVYGDKKFLGLNEQFILDARVPVQLWFPKDSVKENDTLKATSEKILVQEEGGFVHFKTFYFFEYKGSKTLKEQVEEFKKEREYNYSG